MKPVLRDKQMVLGTDTEFPKLKDLKYKFGTDFWRLPVFTFLYRYRNRYFRYRYRLAPSSYLPLKLKKRNH
ncbi:hypothetical protein Hanom_Chr04g00336051 [Helianthus anomalus]